MTIAASPGRGARHGRSARPVSFDRASWRESAACRRLDTEVFFPISRTGLGLLDVQEAKEVCSRCPVRQACLTFALDTQQGYGIWGGCDEDERRLLLRQRHGLGDPADDAALLGRNLLTFPAPLRVSEQSLDQIRRAEGSPSDTVGVARLVNPDPVG